MSHKVDLDALEKLRGSGRRRMPNYGTPTDGKHAAKPPSALDLLSPWLAEHPNCEVAKITLPNDTIGFAVRTQELGRWVYAYGSDVDAAIRAAIEKARRG